MSGVEGWEQEFTAWLTPFLVALGDRRRARWAPVYVRGLLAPGERKSVEPLAARVAPGDYQQLHHFVSGARWDPAPLEALLAAEAERLVGGPDAVLIVDDTALPKQGRHSAGVARQYAGVLGKTANCQVLVSLTLARAEVPVPVALRLFLPEAWTDDAARCRAAGVPEDRLAFRSKPDLALAEIDRVVAAGVTFGLVLADAGYGMSRDFRTGLTARGLTWAVGLLPQQRVYPADVTVRRPRRRRGPGRTGRPRTRPEPTRPATGAAELLATARWRRVTWRDGTKGPLAARFAAVRVRVAEGATVAHSQRLPGEAEVWLVGEERATGERKYYVSNLPGATTRTALVRAIKARWVCEQAHQQLKEELGLDHFEGRSWAGLHRHALLTMISGAFLQHLRLGALRAAPDAAAPPATAASGRGKNRPAPPRAAAAAHAADGAPPRGRAPRRGRAPLSGLPRAAHVPAARTRVIVAE